MTTPSNGAIYTATRDDTEPRHIGDLANPYADITQSILGSQRYWGGSVFGDIGSNDQLDAILDADWIIWDGEFMRIHAVSNTGPHPGARRWRVECSQRQRIGYAQIAGHDAYLDIIEPSPPQLDGKWFPAARLRAVRELIGDGPRPATVLVPNERGELVTVDPWQEP